ncbi:class V aminotransferase [Sphingomonas sp. GCM10030256]|uniref:class V aminotransferase n=1 Tax=Sphingomonas sp. GCM10030256 TaxID=3273427 RepID=UPI003615A54A
MSFKPLFSRSLGAAPGRLHMAAHSHHLWPDASFDGQVECWTDAARLADAKWDRIMGEVWPEAQRHVAEELGTGRSDAIVFAGNTHDFLVRLAAACPRRAGQPLRILTSDGEFHSARRQFARWTESGDIALAVVATEPFADFQQRFVQAASTGRYDLILVSQLLFGSGRVFTALEPLAALADPTGPWVVIDGYHSFMAIDGPFAKTLGEKAFFLAGGYKYAMAGEGMGLMHCPPGFGQRPPITGWYAEFADLTLAPGMVGYAKDAMRFMGATFDASALYRFNAVRRMLQSHGLTTTTISEQVAALHRRLLEAIADTPLGRAELLNPLTGGPHARFLAFRSPQAQRWQAELMTHGCVTDVRGDVLRVGLGLYHDADDVDAFAGLAAQLGN